MVDLLTIGGATAARVLVVGCPGSGKSAIAAKLARERNLPLIHLDRLGWNPNWARRPFREFRSLVADTVPQPYWIIDGNSPNTLDLRATRADLVLWVRAPAHICVWRLLTRTIKNLGRQRDDTAPSCRDNLNPTVICSMLWSVLRYHFYSKPRLLRHISYHSIIPVIVKNGSADSRLALGAVRHGR